MQLYHAICAVSALNLTYSGESTLEEAMQHYHRALSAQTVTSGANDLLSEGVFLRHFLLFIYDLCVPMSDDNGSTGMWKIHLDHLQQIAILRQERFGREPHAFVLWRLCGLDTYACLLGSGSCDFFRTVLQYNMLPPLNHQLPLTYFPADESPVLKTILALNQGVLILTAKIAQIAQRFRHEAIRDHMDPGNIARWQARVNQLQNELSTFWETSVPEYMDPEDFQSGEGLPSQARYIFEHVRTRIFHA